MISFILSVMIHLASDGNVGSVHDTKQDIENVYRVLTIPVDTTAYDDDYGYTPEGEYIESINQYEKE
jgi:hypothetical protein